MAAGPPLLVRVVDVGQGDGLVVISPTGKAVMIDAGDRGAEREMLAELARAGVATLDLVVMTHPHADHIGGMQRVLETVPTRLFLDPGFDHGSGMYARLLEHLEASGAQLLVARAGRRIDLGGGAALEVLAPREPLLTGTRSDANANSIVLRLTYGDTAMLLTGDAEEPTERRLLEAPEQVAADVLKVAHHGSAHSTHAPFLAAVRPRVAVISCGADNKFDHPRPEALDRLAAAGAEVVRTDLHGTITLTSDARTWTVAVSRGDGPRGTVRATEDPAAPRPPPRAPTLPDLNTASADDLMTVEGIGPAKARAIVAWRDEHGPFPSVDALTAVPGIGAKTAARIGEHFSVALPGAPPEAGGEDTP